MLQPKESTVVDKSNNAGADRVFVLRFWGDQEQQPTMWHGEVKELGETRLADRRFVVGSLSAACKVIAAQLRRSIAKGF